MGLIPSDDQFGPIILLHSHGWLSHFEASKCISSQPTSTYYLVLLSLLIEHIHQNHFAYCYASKCSVNGTMLNAYSSTAVFSLRLIQMDYDWHFILCCCYLLNRFAHQCDCLSLLGLNVVIPDKIESFLIKACIEKFERVKRKEKKILHTFQ